MKLARPDKMSHYMGNEVRVGLFHEERLCRVSHDIIINILFLTSATLLTSRIQFVASCVTDFLKLTYIYLGIGIILINIETQTELKKTQTLLLQTQTKNGSNEMSDFRSNVIDNMIDRYCW